MEGFNHLAQNLQSLGFAEQEISVQQSQYSKKIILRINSAKANFQSEISDESNTYFFNGGVAGTISEIVAFVEQLHACFHRTGFEASFEVYDSDLNLIQKFNHN